MTLRLTVAALLVANALALAWQLGAFDSVLGVEARTDREPHRVLQQVQPQSVTVVNGAAVTKGAPGAPPTAAADAVVASPVAANTSGASASVADGAACIEAGPLTQVQLVIAEQSVADLPSEAWRRISRERAASYGIVMGPFPTADALTIKANELDRLKQRFERVPQPNADGSAPAKAPTLLLLQRVASREASSVVLAAMAQRGIRTARVVLLAPAVTTHSLRVEGATPEQLAALKSRGSGVDGKPFAACAAT
jgi:hypothetical protein